MPDRRDSQRALRVIPKLPPLDDATRVDVRRAPERREGAIPSIIAARTIAPTPANVIPFAKPRAIAAAAASQPEAVVALAPPKISPFETPIRSGGRVIEVKPTRAPSAVPASSNRLSTGWTPPGGVKSVAQPKRAPSVLPVTAWPADASSSSASMAAQTLPMPMMQPLAPAPVAPPLTLPAAPEPVMAPALSSPEPENRWAHYDALGLGPPKQTAKQLAQLVVSAYRMLGFAILTIIVIVLVGYIVTTAFFYFSNSWVVPMAVSPTDERVVSQQAQLAEQQNGRDRIADEYNQAERAIAAQQTFQTEFAKAIKSDLEGRRLALGRIRALASAAASTRAAIKSENSAYASASRRRMAEEYAAGLIDRNAMLSGKFQLAQISSSNLSLAERQAEFETRAAELEAQTRSLDAILASSAEAAKDDTPLSYEVLRIKQEYESSKLDLAKSIEARDTLKAALARQDKIVTALKQGAYVRAIADGASVAFVPYGNMSKVAKGKPLYACKLGMVFCHHVGEVLEVLPGEVQFKHPHRDKMLRGQVVELKLDVEDADAAADDVLFVGGKPLLL